jgi:hypothetical protein
LEASSAPRRLLFYDNAPEQKEISHKEFICWFIEIESFLMALFSLTTLVVVFYIAREVHNFAIEKFHPDVRHLN